MLKRKYISQIKYTEATWADLQNILTIYRTIIDYRKIDLGE